MPKILLNSRVSGNKIIRGGSRWFVRKDTAKGVFVWSFFFFFFGVFFFWGVFFLIAWYKKNKKKTVKLFFPSPW